MTSMLPVALKLMAAACFVPALLHGVLGVGGDHLIGAPVPNVIDPTLDSQNRFYGVAFGIFAASLWLAASDIRKYAQLLRIVFIIFFVAGCARFLSLFAFGWPSQFVTVLWAAEILIPPVLWFWLKRYEATQPS